MKLIVNRDNRVTLPAALRRLLGLRPGDAVQLSVHDGGLLMRPAIGMPMPGRQIGTVPVA
ncbi:AbrB/MazE/SpoVT family DNA-binding domain-containing protein [Sphingomonas bisphenolicum]|uniref:AbrB/MazE/SpoVT family DNA-binding domain-containing protein n=1 Tax=Sphingomonas bisphenolicum TaxID=296544 RepID=UPI0036F1D491